MHVRVRSFRFTVYHKYVMWRRSLGSAEASLVICHFYWDTQREPLRRRASKRSRRDICHAVISAVISCRLLSPATDWANIYLNTFSIILGHHTAMIILMSCGISKGSNQSLRKTCGFQRALTSERQWFVAQHDSPAVGKSIVRFFSVGLQWLWFLMIKLVCVTVFQTFHFCCL